MTSITGTIRIGEAQATVAATARRQRGASWQYIALMTAMWIGGALIGFFIGHTTGFFDENLAGCAGALIGLLAYHFFAKRLVIWRFRHRLTGAGTPLDMPVRLAITPEALVYAVAEVEKRGVWSAVSELFHAKGYWIFMVQSEPWFAPDHFFQSDADKRAFLREALSHMRDEARTRSPDAVKFVEGGR